MSRTSTFGSMEDAVANRLKQIFATHPDLRRADIRPAPADKKGWSSNATAACRVVLLKADYGELKEEMGSLWARRGLTVMLSWRFKSLGGDAEAYPHLDAARLALFGWRPSVAPDEPKLSDVLAVDYEQLSGVDGANWNYEQVFVSEGVIWLVEEEEILAQVQRIQIHRPGGGDFSPPVDVSSEEEA